MVLLDQIWDDVVAGPRPDHGFGNLRKITTKDGEGGEGTSVLRSLSLPASPGAPSTPMTPTTPSPTAARKDNVWRSVFNPGSNPATRNAGSEFYDKPQPNSKTVYDWLYSGDTRSKHHH